jgi:hypothetical protein
MLDQAINKSPHGLLNFTEIKRLVRLRQTRFEIYDVCPDELRFDDVGVIDAEVSKTCLGDCILVIEFCFKLEVF